MSLALRSDGTYYCTLMINRNRFAFNTASKIKRDAESIEKTVAAKLKEELESGTSLNTIKQNLKEGSYTNVKKSVKLVSVNAEVKPDENAGMLLEDAMNRAYTSHFSTLKNAKGVVTYQKRMLEVAQKVFKKKYVLVAELRANPIAQIREYLEKNTKLSASTINRHFAYLKKLLTIANKEWEVITYVPHIKITAEHTGRIKVYTEQEESDLIAFLESKQSRSTSDKMRKEISLFFQVLIDTGMRLSEALNLTYADNIDFNKKVIRLIDPDKLKSKKARIVPMTNRVFDILQARSSNIKPFNFQYDSLLQSFKRVRRDMGITDPEFCFHACRHTFATRLLEKGMHVYDVSKLLGHSSVNVTEKYLHANDERFMKAAQLLNK